MSYGKCHFWTGKRYCGKDGIYREEYNDYYCTDHYEWHQRFAAKLEKMVKKAKEESSS